MNLKSFLPLLIAFFVLSCGEQAFVREEAMEMPTYPFDDPDAVAHPHSSIYPYFTFDGYARQSEKKEWNTVILENDYIKVYIMPEIGGKIWGAVEKSTGKDFLYFNHSVKFRNISMRGPWTSGGIEPNFAIFGHAPTTASPVDYCTRKNEDGSVSCFVGAFDLITRTRWQEEINLPADKAYFTTNVTWQNTTPVARPCYHWQNAAYTAADDLTFYYPGQYFIGHDGIPLPWHIDEKGRDLSVYGHHTFSGDKSFHVLGQLSDFYAAYYPSSRFGSVHHADYGDKPGRKIFIWGLSRQGMIWEDLLTDTDGQYVELQSGRLYNQAAGNSNLTPFKQFAFEPLATDKWTEYWFPVKETDGVVAANPYGSLNVTRSGDSVTIAFCPVSKIKDNLTVTSDDKAVFSQPLSLDVMQTWTKTVKVGHLPIKITLGNQKLVFSEKPDNELYTRPLQTPASFDWNSAYGLYLKGEQELYFNNRTEAEKLLKQSLSLEPFAIPALRDLATVYYQWGQWEKADSCARIILSINTYDPDGNLLFGLANSKMGNHKEAMDGFHIATITASQRTVARIFLAKEYARKGQWEKVREYAEKCIEQGGRNAEALQLKLLACRKLGIKSELNAGAKEMEQFFPLNHYARFEKYALTTSEQDKNKFITSIRSELPYEILMDMAGWYEEAGCDDEALTLYTLNEDYPIANYRAAYLLYKKGSNAVETQRAASLLKQAESQSIELVFPSRPETVPALKWAVEQSDNWINKYYLAILYACLGQTWHATSLLEQCGDQPDKDLFYLARAGFRKGEMKCKDLLTAEQKGAQAWRTGLELIKYYQDNQQYDEMYDCARKYAERYPDNDILGLKYALSMLRTKRYADCTEFLSKLHVLPNEGASEGRQVYHEAWLNLAKQSINAKDYAKALTQIETARQYPEQLGVGKPYDADIDMRVEDSLTVLCHDKINNKQN
jgi:Tfp pilus assembly protein PilF